MGHSRSTQGSGPVTWFGRREHWESADGDEAQAELCRDAEAKFLYEHVTPYLPRFAERLATAAPEGGHHAALARVLMQVG